MDGQLAGMLFFMAMPYLVVFGIGGGLLIAHRRSRTAEPRNGGGD